MLHLRGYKYEWDLIQIPFFLDPETGKDITLESSKRLLADKVREALLSPQHVKGHSLRIGGATAYENSPDGGSITAGFLGLWASGARRAYMHAYRPPLELTGLAVARESQTVLAVRPGPVAAYAQAQVPR